MHAPREEVAACVAATITRLPELRDGGASCAEAADAVALAERLNAQFPGDVGVLGGAFFLNHIRMRPGDAVFVGPGEPHAYVAGECAECMACSDNVVRAGLTPKEIDVETLLAMLTYRQGPPHVLAPTVVRDGDGCELRVFEPPVEEFAVADWSLVGAACKRLPFAGRDRVVLVLEGSGSVGGHPVARGSAVYVPPDDGGVVVVVQSDAAAMRMLVAMSGTTKN